MTRITYISADADPRLAEWLTMNNCTVRSVKTEGLVAAPLCCHPDMFMCRMGERIISMFDSPDMTRPGNEYPQDICYNAACTGRFFIHNLKYTAPELIREAEQVGMTVVNVRQGYTKCSTVIVDEESIITYDKGICKACSAAGMDVLLVTPGHVLLPGYDTGFIGGCSGRIGDTIVFNGDLSSHPNFDRILEFIENKGLEAKWFVEWPLTDIGSII